VTGLYVRATIVLSSLLVLLGVGLVLETALAGGGGVGYLLGTLLALAGALRVYLTTRRG